MTTYQDAVPPKVRTTVYFILLGFAGLTLGVEGLSEIWLADELADKVARSAGVVLAVVGVIAGGMGVTYRPTRNAPQAGGQAPTIGR